MFIAANIVIGLVAFTHVYILVLEMFLWDSPAGLRAFGLTPQAAAASKVLAANQGLYNGFLAAGLFWGLSLGTTGTSIKIFFLGCVLVAGLYGAATANRKILFVQAIPAAVAACIKAVALPLRHINCRRSYYCRSNRYIATSCPGTTISNGAAVVPTSRCPNKSRTR